MLNLSVKTRFCPSPTGHIHLGNARTALFNALYAAANNGIFLLRIEDTDVERSKTEYVTALKEDLQWLGLNWQEGPDHDLKNGPYYQSQRQSIYHRYYEILEREGLAYPCFCSEEDLAIMRKLQRASGKPPRYAGTCYSLSAAEIEKKRAAGVKSTLRFHIENESVIEFLDLVRGPQRFSGNEIGDFIIRRADGSAPFLFSNAIDDALMGVTYALRGEDHLTNTPRQILIARALKLTSPHYGHISLIVGPDGSPLSKRHGSRSIKELRELGFLPEAINNYMARLGHYYDNDAFMSLKELAQSFKLERLGRAPAKFDSNQLLRWQQEAITHYDNNALWQWMNAETRSLVPSDLRDVFIAAIKPNIRFPEDVLKWAKIFFNKEINVQSEMLRMTGKPFFDCAITALNLFGSDFKKISDSLQQQLNIKGKNLYQPLRVALTGELHGPEMALIFQLLSKEEILHRFEMAGKVAAASVYNE